MATIEDILAETESLGIRLNPTLTEEEAVAFETRYGVSLPPEYRAFMMHIGSGGDGPGCGLFGFHGMDEGRGNTRWVQGGEYVGILSKPFPYTDRWNDQTGRPPEELLDEDEFKYEELMEEWRKQYFHPLDGAIPICDGGCAIYEWLVITGPEAGYVWIDQRADYSGVYPARSLLGPRITFLDWYQEWLKETNSQRSSSWGDIRRCPSCGAGNLEKEELCSSCKSRL